MENPPCVRPVQGVVGVVRDKLGGHVCFLVLSIYLLVPGGLVTVFLSALAAPKTRAKFVNFLSTKTAPLISLCYSTFLLPESCF